MLIINFFVAPSFSVSFLGKIYPSGMNDILFMTLGKLEHPGRVRGAGQGATISNYFHTSRRHHQGITNDEVTRLVELRLQEERKI